MRDRTPTRALENGALRYGVYAEDGSLLRYEYLALEDDPTDPGTELSKATLLQDSTEVSLFGSAADRTIDEAFAGIAGQLKLIKSDSAAITLTVQDTGGKPIPEVLVQGILSESGQAVYTNTSGVVTGYIGEGAQVIKVSGYADLVDFSETVTVVKGTTINKTIKLTTRNFLKITASKSVKFSGNVNAIDVSVGSGGGAGASMSGYAKAASGGGGGHTKKVTGFTVKPNTPYPAIIGAGGLSQRPGEKANGAPGLAGGTSSFMGVTAEPGTGGKPEKGIESRGTGNGNGGYANSYSDVKPGEAGTETIYSSFTAEEKYGGGGGALGKSNNDDTSSSAGGQPAGGAGNSTGGVSGTDGLGGGGGAGGGSGILSHIGGRGGNGCVAIRMHLKSAA